MMPTASASPARSGRMCDEMMMARPRALSRNSASRSLARAPGSSALAGSSSSSTLGACISVLATPSRCRMPRDRARMGAAALGLEVELLEQRVDAPLARGVVDLVAAAEEVEVVDRRHLIVEREVVGQVADAPAHALGIARGVEPVDADGAAGRPLQRRQHAQRRALAGAVGPDEREDAAGGDRKGQGAHGVAHAVVGEGDSVAGDHVSHDTGGGVAIFLERSSRLELGQRRRRVLVGAHLAVRALDAPVGADEIAIRVAVPCTGVAGGAVGQADLLVGVA